MGVIAGSTLNDEWGGQWDDTVTLRLGDGVEMARVYRFCEFIFSKLEVFKVNYHERLLLVVILVLRYVTWMNLKVPVPSHTV